MARLHKLDDDSTWLAPAHCVIGRSRACQLRVGGAEVSGEHALLRWRNGVWVLQDLGSRNGTYVGGVLLGAGQRVGLAEGAKLGFGNRDGFELVDVSPPTAHAVAVDRLVPVVEAVDGLLTLPSPQTPELMIFRREQEWRLEAVDSLEFVVDGKIVSTSAGLWRLHLPDPIPPTRDNKDVALTLDSVSLEFRVLPERGAVALMVVRGARRLDLKIRTHHSTLLALARARLDDPVVAPHERGWIHQEVLVDRLGYDLGRLHVEIHRLRRQLARAGILDAVNVVERRRDTGELRLGVASVKILGSPG